MQSERRFTVNFLEQIVREVPRFFAEMVIVPGSFTVNLPEYLSMEAIFLLLE